MIIGTFLPTSEYYGSRVSQTLVVSTSMCIIFLLLIFVINRTIDVKIIDDLEQVMETLAKELNTSADASVEVTKTTISKKPRVSGAFYFC